MPTKEEVKAKAAELRKALKKLDAFAGGDGERAAQSSRMRDKRANEKDVAVPACEDPVRRASLEADDVAWLMYYFAAESGCDDPFTYQFTAQQLDMIAAIRTAIVDGGDQALAASRGEGKTLLCERMLLKYTLQGVLRFAVLFAATGAGAENSLDSIKGCLENNDRLAADYPEVVTPVLALDNTPNRAHYMTVSGKRHDNGKPYHMAACKFTWCGQEVILPNVPGSPAARGIIATRGLDAAVRGVRKKGRRVDLAVIDDPDTEETARSEDQAEKLEGRIDKAIAGLGGQKRNCGRVMLTTLQSRISVSYKFTDPVQKPSWKGKRFRFLIKKPDRMDLWDEYISLRRADWVQGTTDAHELYVASREAMETGAVVSNPNRYVNGELSALQFYFNKVAQLGPDAVATEYDNDPPEESGPIESGITAHRVQRQVSGYARRILPPGVVLITQGIDARKVALHWVIRAWRADGTGFTIDYGVHEVLGTVYGSDEGVDTAIRRAILARMEVSKTTDYMTSEGGECKQIDLTLVDAGWRTDAVYAACAEIGLGIMPVMGFGRSSGCTQANFSEYQRATQDKRPGDGWFLSRKGKLWLVCADTDRWKAWEHDRWMTDPLSPGTMMLFGSRGERQDRMSDDEKNHHAYARHITNELEVEEIVKGVLKRHWKAKSENTHWLDASYYADVAANIKGIRIEAASAPAKKVSTPALAAPSERRTLAEMAQAARGK